MPTYPPRSEPVKKQEELAQKEIELIVAIKRNASVDKLIKCAGKYKEAQLSLLKAKIHQFKENELKERPNNIQLEKLQEQIVKWTGKTNEDIIKEIKKTHKLK